MIAPPERERYVPTPEELAALPELAIVDVLDYALVTARAALLAAQPDLALYEMSPADGRTTPDSWLAENLIAQIDSLETTLRIYRAAASVRRCWIFAPRPAIRRTP